MPLRLDLTEKDSDLRVELRLDAPFDSQHFTECILVSVPNLEVVPHFPERWSGL